MSLLIAIVCNVALLTLVGGAVNAWTAKKTVAR